jgi:hypothetical protein
LAIAGHGDLTAFFCHFFVIFFSFFLFSSR